MSSRLHYLRLEAEGSSAAEVENELALALARIARVTGLKFLVDSQVIELNKNQRPTPAFPVDETGVATVHDPMSPWANGWYFGRLTAFPSDRTQPNE
jgi:hypothetical protein